MADTDCASEAASSVGDEDRVRRLFQACDGNGDGYIDSQDLLTICQELSLEDSLEELMHQLGADSEGKISYEQFLNRRLALRPEIDALKVAAGKDTISSSNSQGKIDSWEWDSGARDMSPIPKNIGKKITHEKHVSTEERFKVNGDGGVPQGDNSKSCLTTYIFNPAETCTGTPSPEKFALSTDSHNSGTLKLSPRSEDVAIYRRSPISTEVAHMHSNLLYGKVLPAERPSFFIDYDISYGGTYSTTRRKTDFRRLSAEMRSGLLYTISKSEKEERMYDEPYAGDLPRRSWLCCPGSQAHIEPEQPSLIGDPKTPTTPTDNVVIKAPGLGCCGTCERLQQSLDEQAQRYEEQLTELHSVIAELSRKLHQQRTMAIAEEDEVSESCTSAHEESVTCPLDVSELEPIEHELSDLENKLPPLPESPLELPEPKLANSHRNNSEVLPFLEVVEPLKQEITSLKQQLHEAHTRLAQISLSKIDETVDAETVTEYKNMDSPESHIEVDCETQPYGEDNEVDIKYGSIVPIHTDGVQKSSLVVKVPVMKMAERIKLKRAADDKNVSPSGLFDGDLTTAVAEHIVGDILSQCDAQSEKQSMDLELQRAYAKLEHSRAQNTVLALTLTETKAHCDRLALLCGKYESNAIALRLALALSDRAIEAYDVLLALLETEVSLNEEQFDTVQNRKAAETVARQLLGHLDTYQEHTEVLLSPWQNHVYTTPSEMNEPWTPEHELRLRDHVSRLKAERSNIQGTYVSLESPQVENVPVKPANNQEARKMDLEMAVLMQELLGLREDKSELLSKLFVTEKEKAALELKFRYLEGQQKAKSAALRNLQGHLKDTEQLLALATQTKERGYSDAEHAQGVEVELMQALARESRLKVRLQELVATLESVTKNAEARLLEGREMVQDLNHANSLLADTVDRNSKKFQAKYKKMENQMFSMAEKHNLQLHTLQQKIASLETPPTNSPENSLKSVPI